MKFLFPESQHFALIPHGEDAHGLSWSCSDNIKDNKSFNEKMSVIRKILVFTTTNLYGHAQNDARHFTVFSFFKLEISRH